MIKDPFGTGDYHYRDMVSDAVEAMLRAMAQYRAKMRRYALGNNARERARGIQWFKEMGVTRWEHKGRKII